MYPSWKKGLVFVMWELIVRTVRMIEFGHCLYGREHSAVQEVVDEVRKLVVTYRSDHLLVVLDLTGVEQIDVGFLKAFYDKLWPGEVPGVFFGKLIVWTRATPHLANFEGAARYTRVPIFVYDEVGGNLRILQKHKHRPAHKIYKWLVKHPGSNSAMLQADLPSLEVGESLSSASNHLSRLWQSGLVYREPRSSRRGRHFRYTAYESTEVFQNLGERSGP